MKFYRISFLFSIILIQSCSTFRYKTYDEESNKDVEDPEPDYSATLDENFQNFTSYMFIGNRVENFGTYFNTYFNAKENFDNAYDDYATRVLSVYSERLDSILAKPSLSQEAADNFNKAIEKASKIIQYHKSSQFMDESVLLVGKSYYYLGDYLKAERKFSEFISRLPVSRLLNEAQLFLAKTQMRLDNVKPALEKLDELTAKSSDKNILSGAYQSKAEYYLSIKDYENAIKNFKKAIEFSKDSEFKAQMQFLVATVTEKTNKIKAASEFDKVLDYGVSFDLEYLARYNYTKNLIANNNFGSASKSLEDLEVKYKDNAPFLGEIGYLKGLYYEQKKDMNRALAQYYYVIQNYPSTKPSSNSSFRIAQYEENTKLDYLNAYRYYRFSTEQSLAGTYAALASSKMKTFKRYYELRSIIAGTTINTDYDSLFKAKTSNIPLNEQNEQNIPGKEHGKPGGLSSVNSLIDSLLNEKGAEDSVNKRIQEVAKAKFELAE
ncbi:MAG TPA: tetratricopeptide repeat protein, partial [Ignavibacteria bacterium]